MNSKFSGLQLFRVLLFPFAVLYGLVVRLRNYLYDKDIIQSTSFNFPVIAVGNLSVGGTGKSPMVEYLLELLSPCFKIATLSRGYKRKTRGYVLANDKATAIDIGDEPMQFHLKYPQVSVAVGEERAIAIPQILFDRPDTDMIIMDDAFQHRAVNAGLNILLTAYQDLFCNDYLLPMGSLRDTRSSYRRANIIVVTKCPQDITEENKKKIIRRIAPLDHQQVFFSAIRYGEPYHILTQQTKRINEQASVLLICGIANPAPLKNYILESAAACETLYYRDHYIFTIDDLKEMIKRYEKMSAGDKMIIITEKDAVRLVKFDNMLKDIPLYVLPIQTQFLFEGAAAFNSLVQTFVESFKEKHKLTL